VQEVSQGIRPADVADADAIAQVHITAWRETYLGTVPASVLTSLSLVRHAELWRSRLSGPTWRTSTFVATDAVGMVVGFGSCGPSQAALLRYDGEIYAIYILRRAQHQGLGRRLMAAMARRLQERAPAPPSSGRRATMRRRASSIRAWAARWSGRVSIPSSAIRSSTWPMPGRSSMSSPGSTPWSSP
jgi:ribosomal protein S18 acetylase RimI-like enzyme